MENTLTLDRIKANPNPNGTTWRCRVHQFITWGKQLHREAALDSARNVLAIVGAGTILADFSTMKLWFILPGAALACGIWYVDYCRHFDGKDA